MEGGVARGAEAGAGAGAGEVGAWAGAGCEDISKLLGEYQMSIMSISLILI